MGIHLRGFAPDHPALKYYRETDKLYGRKIKIVPQSEYSSKVSIDVGGNLVRIFDPEEAQGVLIENARIAKTVREIFEMVWKSRPEKIEGAVDS